MKYRRVSPAMLVAVLPIIILSVLLHRGETLQPLPVNNVSTTVAEQTPTAWVRGTHITAATTMTTESVTAATETTATTEIPTATSTTSKATTTTTKATTTTTKATTTTTKATTTTTKTTTTTTKTTTTTAKTQPAAKYAGAYPEFLSTYPLDEAGIPLQYTKVIEGTACAYTAGPGAVTATGTTPRLGTVAVNPKVIPYGSKLFIVSNSGYVYGYAIASDTGGDLLNNNILVDLYMNTREDCLNFGRRTVKIYVLE